MDEKSQIQALDRTAPCLPMLPTTDIAYCQRVID